MDHLYMVPFDTSVQGPRTIHSPAVVYHFIIDVRIQVESQACRVLGLPCSFLGLSQLITNTGLHGNVQRIILWKRYRLQIFNLLKTRWRFCRITTEIFDMSSSCVLFISGSTKCHNEKIANRKFPCFVHNYWGFLKIDESVQQVGS